MASVALLAPAAQAQEARQQELTLGATGFSYFSYQRPSAPFLVLEAAYHRRIASEGPWSAVRLGGGVRTGVPGGAIFPLEGFVQVQLSARIGIWEAMLGPELGLSGYAKLATGTLLPMQELKAQEDARLGPVYVAFNAAPVRLHFGRVVASALELQLGTSPVSFGSAVRVQVGLLKLGVEL
ncbi:hypothetical protein KYC5002_32365 [Archangium violaceum]|uniref:hypothetical protein n=1 Tax=Archangium violaceum TaxID=83451 RepID=UPI002B2F843B|nr:hypothetical protein KYC5002_32365 [Archangium gephyra]